MSVNVPMNKAQKDKDVAQKLQLYGIMEAFSEGKVPSNKQIDVALNSFLASRALSKPSSKLSTEGQNLVADVRKVVEEAKLLLLSKNQGELLQDFIWQSQVASGGSASTPGAPIDKNTAKQHGNQALDGFRTLGTLILSNGQFRKLLSDMVTLLRDVAGDGAQKAANKVNPDQDALEHIDEPAPENQWHDVPSKDDLKNKAKDKYHTNKPFDAQDVKQAANEARGTANQQGNNRDGMLKGAMHAADNLQEKSRQNVPDDQQDAAREKKDRLKDYAKEKMPKERREQIIYRLKKMIVEIQGHPDYQQAIDTLLALAEQYKGHTKSIVGQTENMTKEAHHTDDGINRAEYDLKTLLERFANFTSSDDLFDAINAIYHDADRDPELKGWFRHMNSFIRAALKEQGYILKDSSTQEWNKLYDHGDYLINDRYQDHFQRIGDEVKFFANEFDNDRQNKSFADAVKQLFLDLGNDENGKPTFKPHLIQDLSNVIIPAIFTNIRYVPVPRIEYSDPMADAIIENLVIEGDNLAPNVFEFGSDNYFRWGRKTIQNKNKNKVMLSVSGIQMDLKDVSYYVKKKHGFPSLTDTGVMDIFLGGSGFSFKLALETADKHDQNNFFKVNKVDVDIQHINIRLKQSKHKLLFALVKPLLLKVMRPILQKVIEAQIRSKIHDLDSYCYSIKKEVDRAAEKAKQNPEQAQNIYQQYFNAFQQKMQSGKQKKDQAAADKAVNVAVTREDSLFPQIKLPGGISTKATEYKQMARQGDKWQSPIFSIGNAGETSHIPGVQKVTRKQHQTHPSKIRGDNNLGQSVEQGYSNSNDHSFGKDREYTGGQQNYGQQQGYGGESYGQETYQPEYVQPTYVQPTYATGQSDINYDSFNTNGALQGNSALNTYESEPLHSTGQTGVHTTLGLANPVLKGIV